jgi:hypothetical protein
LDIPPNAMIYDCRQRKRRKTVQQNPPFPSIHVHNHLPGSSARIQSNYDAPVSPLPKSLAPPTVILKKSTTPLLLDPHAGHSTQPRPQPIIDLTDSESVIDLTNSDNDNNTSDDDIRYPSVSAMLVELDREYPALEFVRYQQVLTGNGFVYVSQLAEERVAEQLRDFWIPVGVINILISRAARLMRRAEKLKQED